MNISLYIARRYLFSKKSHNAINIISLIAVCGVAVATMATVCTLSVFNGFEGMVSDMFSNLDPELKITPVTGKVFDPQEESIQTLYTLPDIEMISESLEDNIFINYRGRQVYAVLKGVSDNYGTSSRIDDILIDGTFTLEDSINFYGTLGVGLANKLGVNAGFVYPMEVFTINRNAPVNMTNPATSLNRTYPYIGGVFQTSPVYDENYMIVPIAEARTLFDYETEVSALEIKLKKGTDINKVQQSIEKVLGDELNVKNRYQQQESTFKMMTIEKWVSFLMLCFILIIAVFNIVSSLSMLIVDKRQDVQTLRNLGADNRLISRIFLFEGWMISAIGAVSGIILGVLLCLGQLQFGWLQLGSGSGAFRVDAYPVHVVTSDLVLILITVLLIGFLSVLYPVKYLSKTILHS